MMINSLKAEEQAELSLAYAICTAARTAPPISLPEQLVCLSQ